MPTIQQLNGYAQTAQAAYAIGLVAGASNGTAYQDATTAGMSAAQATAFDTTWNVLQQSTPTISGFSAVLLQNRTTGEKVLAIAGTDPSSPADLITDVVNIALYGTVLGMPQYASLESFYMQLMSSGKLGAAEQISVTGHSLGGFLAQAFTARHTNVVSAAYTYNAPGFGTAELMLGFLGVTDTAGAAAKITNVHATDGFSMTAGLGVMLGASQPVRIEADTNLLNNHSVVRLGDALAVYDIYARLQPSITMEQASALFVASGTGSRRLEDALDALRTVFIGSTSNDVNKTPTGDREAFFNNLAAMTAATGPASFQALKGQVQLVAASSSFAMLAQADTNAALAYRYALLELQPFAVVAATDAANQTLYGYYTERLSLFNEATGQGSLTQAYVQDRSKMLALVVERNKTDYGGIINGTENLRYFDAQTNIQLLVGAGSAQRTQIVFGGDAADTADGQGFADHLYGGAGNDSLNGLGGEDYLEGNADHDSLNGGAGVDTLLGGAGDDILDGGEHSDTLLGGAGNDSYVLKAADGVSTDTIHDAGGQGSIKVIDTSNAEIVLGQGALTRIADGANLWISEDKRFTYTTVLESDASTTLSINGAGVRAQVLNFSDGNLGLSLPGLAPAKTTPDISGINVAGDRAPVDFDPVAPGVQTQVDQWGNVIVGGAAEPDRIDTLYDSPGDDLIISGGGADLVYASRGGSDLVQSDSGTDHVELGAGDDFAELGSERDNALGGTGDDQIYGGLYRPMQAVLDDTLAGAEDQADLLAGNAGEDTLVGGASGDALWGGDGKDQMYADRSPCAHCWRHACTARHARWRGSRTAKRAHVQLSLPSTGGEQWLGC